MPAGGDTEDAMTTEITAGQIAAGRLPPALSDAVPG